MSVKTAQLAQENRVLMWELDDVDRRLIKLKIQHPTLTYKKLGEAVNMPPTKVSERMKRPAFQYAMNELLKTADEYLVEAKRLAAYRLQQLVNSKDQRIALEASKFLLKQELDRSSVEVTQRQEHVHTVQIGDAGNIYQTIEAVPLKAAE